MKTAQIIDFDLAVIAARIKSNFNDEQSDGAEITTLAERKQARRKAIAEDLTLVRENPPPEGFVAWVKGNCPFGKTQAYQYLEDFGFPETGNSPDAPATPPKKSKGGRPKGKAEPKPKPAGPTTWLQAIQIHFNGFPPGYGNVDRPKDATRIALTAECGFDLPCERDKFPAVLEAMQRLLDRKDTAAATARIDAEIHALPEKAQARIKRLAAEKANIKRAEMQAEFDAKVESRVEFLKKSYSEDSAAAADEMTRYVKLNSTLDTWLSKDEFRRIQACLHTDTARTRTDAQLNEAYNIFNRLREYVNVKTRERMGGW